MTQGRRQTCLSIAATTAHEHLLKRSMELSVEYLFYNTVGCSRDGNPDVGRTLEDTASALSRLGQPVADAWPYLAVQTYAPDWVPPPFDDETYTVTLNAGTMEFDEIAQAIDGGRPVILGLYITDAFIQCGPTGKVADRTPDQERAGHAVLAVGHGSNGAGMDHLLVRNSWGARWGLDGHAWLSRNYVSRQTSETAMLESDATEEISRWS